MEEIVFAAEPRDVIGKHVKSLRREGKLPAILYGKHISPIAISLDHRVVSRTLAHVSQSTLVTIKVAGDTHVGLIREKQRDVLSGEFLHLDIQVVSLAENIRTNVSIALVGEAPAVKLVNGIVFSSVDVLEVEALPRDLPEKIQVDISGLSGIGDAIHVRDLAVSDKVRILADEDTLIVVITAQAAEEVEVVEEAVIEPEVIEKGKKEEEE